MNRNTVLAAVVFTAFFFVATSRAELNEWTVAVYQGLDDNESATLEDSGIRDLAELAKVSKIAGVKFIAQADRGEKVSRWQRATYDDPEYRGATRYVVGDGRTDEVAKLGEVNMGSPYTFWKFLTWMADEHAARHYCVILAGHGSGIFSWRGTGSTGSAVPGQVDFDPDRFVGYDDTDNDSLTIFELNAVLRAFRERKNHGRKLDIIAFDACLSGTIEALYELREGVDIMVASASTIPMSGFNYTGIGQAIVDDPHIAPERLANAMVDSFISASRGSNILAGWRTSAVEDVVSCLSRLSLELLRAADQAWFKLKVFDGLTYAEDRGYWDLERLCRSLATGKTELRRADNEAAIVEVANEALEAVVACNVAFGASGRFLRSGACGLSVAAPPKKKYGSWKAFYEALDFSHDTHWDELVEKHKFTFK